MDQFLQIVLALMALLLALTLLLVIGTLQRRKLEKERYQQGILWLQLLRDYLTQTQKHRGLVNGYLNGDKGSGNAIAKLQRELSLLNLTLQKSGKWLQKNERWKAIQEHWQRLSSNYMNHQAGYALEQHNKLILNILHLIEECAEQHHLQELTIAPECSVEALWKNILFNAEFIGQARAVGTGVTAAKHCSSVERIRLKYLHSRIREYQQSQNGLASSKELLPLLSAIETDVIVTEPQMSSRDYFALATRALDTVMKEFDRGLVELSRQIPST